MTTQARRIQECRTADQALHSLCHWFYEDRLSVEGCEAVEADGLPAAYRELLVHHDHMTTRLERYHGRPVSLHVLNYRHDGDLYSRNVLLKLNGGDEVVEFGIVRMDLGVTGADVRSRIIERRTPLGEILMSHDVLRRVEPRWYFRFGAESPLTAHFGKRHRGDAYGRVGIIYYDHQPAIELLEVVTEARGGAER